MNRNSTYLQYSRCTRFILPCFYFFHKFFIW